MKVLVTLLSLALLAACTPRTGLNKAKGEYLCRNNGGIYFFYSFSEYPVVCNDGTAFTIKQLETIIIKDPEYLPE
ncbi:hypothetical protein AD45P2_00205 [Alteromonas phage vB_AmaP_AD45-P2]|uniref:Lipoprotein n=1 Tax=Pseudorhizobium pelagicum TaxID=1509405 RepID=A0A922NY60_9HYPH|nr:hypothetical protein [Pseudorhizobium pelagicum]YP_008126013.1 hypothetical protein M610_gp042 [Alteromonas phage vB_AmaP_AD45-P1]AGM46980.1 hypothetical protein AD45P3_00210 [Alteromonas phage vB_AmaP_AD45-P3]AGM47097.1 hypothetical protein AD45P4_00210 [Alteromonas phage vB_AmaP_AD45-P4]AGM47212.1 hypothetical protein AD45P2_00205 [Alteromonas phage vB_AmaP_AD45-P2]AGM46860.1 hypothetical protein AD45P1_00210 [Alteromonas phage vB_AmaP_AD45-P1]KEQ05550.1 hypothetical protein GV68_08450 [